MLKILSCVDRKALHKLTATLVSHSNIRLSGLGVAAEHRVFCLETAVFPSKLDRNG